MCWRRETQFEKLVRDSKTRIGEELTVRSELDGKSRKQKQLEKETKGVWQAAHGIDAHGKHLVLSLSDSLFDDTDEFLAVCSCTALCSSSFPCGDVFIKTHRMSLSGNEREFAGWSG